VVCVWQCCSHIDTNRRTRHRRPGFPCSYLPITPASHSLSPLPTGGPVTAQRRAATHTHPPQPPHAMRTHIPNAQCVASCDEPAQPDCSCSTRLHCRLAGHLSASHTSQPDPKAASQLLAPPPAWQHPFPIPHSSNHACQCPAFSHNPVPSTHTQPSRAALSWLASPHIWPITEPCASCDPYRHMRPLQHTTPNTPPHPACLTHILQLPVTYKSKS
jgi:hypothetical protein